MSFFSTVEEVTIRRGFHEEYCVSMTDSVIKVTKKCGFSKNALSCI